MSQHLGSSAERSPNIFVNYRREDSAGHAGRLFDRLSGGFPGRVFMDIDTLEPGVDFVDVIEQAVGSCEVLIVLIGHEWLSLKDATGRRRLDDPADFVRLELATALQRKIRVIPVLVQGATMPPAEELPPDLAKLARRNAIELSDARWAYDVDRLIHTIAEVLQGSEPRAPLAAVTERKEPAPAGRAAWSQAWIVLLAAVVLSGAGWTAWKTLKQQGTQPIVVPPPAVEKHQADTETSGERRIEARHVAAPDHVPEIETRRPEPRIPVRAPERKKHPLAPVQIPAPNETRRPDRPKKHRAGTESGEGPLEINDIILLEPTPSPGKKSPVEPAMHAQGNVRPSAPCPQGSVWREAGPGDRVCVPPGMRQRVADDNRQAEAHRNPSGGEYGPDTCVAGYVWREAFENDHVCVTPETRKRTIIDNLSANRVSPG